jgi:outer membrane protein OmpA-like peptidoglycan-associated protein
VVKQGYLLASETFIPKNDSVYSVDIKLKKMALGDRINLENIKFDSDKTEILAESQTALDQLKTFLDVNPGMHIELQGHENGESKRNKKKYRKLSAARAKAIHDKLVEAGVAKSRLSVVGFGNARMIFPTPVNNRQAEANRRVEAEVTRL